MRIMALVYRCSDLCVTFWNNGGKTGVSKVLSVVHLDDVWCFTAGLCLVSQ